MEFKLFRFVKKNILLTAIFAVLGWGIFSFLLNEFYFNIFPFLLLFYCLLSILIQYMLYKIAKMDIGKFSARFMAITMLKLFVLLILALVYILLNKENAIQFIVVFFIFYVGYTVLEIQDIMKITGKK